VSEASVTDEHWTVDTPVYVITLWNETSPGQWLSEAVRLEGAADVLEAIDRARAYGSTAFVLAIQAPRDPHGRIILMGNDPVPGTPLNFI
jgi:hypothetical protein